MGTTQNKFLISSGAFAPTAAQKSEPKENLVDDIKRRQGKFVMRVRSPLWLRIRQYSQCYHTF